MAQNPFSLDAWTRARNRFLEDLTDEEQCVFFQASPETILYDASATDKIHRVKSATREIVTKLQPFVEAVEQYGKALDVYSNVHPLVMGPLWGSVRIVLHLARESGKYFEKIADMFCRISDLLPRLRVYEQLFPDHERLVQALSIVYFDVLKFCTDAKDMFRKSKHAMFSLTWKSFQRQFGFQMDAFRRHQKEIEKEVSLSHMIEARDSRALLRSTQMNLAKERYDEDRLGVFATLSSTVDYEAKHRKLRGLRHEGTGMWVIQHQTYLVWKECIASKGLIFYGIPGSGKSVLTSLMVEDHLEGPNPSAKNVIYFYCDHADSPTLQPVFVYRALLQQIFFRGLMTEAVEKVVVEILKTNIHGLSEQKLADLIYTAIQSCEGLHVIIDGLDECERNAQQEITKTLHRLLTAGRPIVKVLVTCRDEGHLLTRFNDFDRLHISTQDSADDIQSYIFHAIASSLSSGDLTIRNPALKGEIVSKLVDKAQGMFLWVHFQITDLCDAVSDEDIRQILEHLPEGLYDTYTRIFMKIAKTGCKATVLKVMMWMVCARRPLHLEELREAVAFDSYDKSWNVDKIPDGDRIMRSCHGLVVRDADDGKVRLAHHTILQYLVCPQESIMATDFEEVTPGAQFWPELNNFRYDSDSAEIMAGSFCVTYLCFADFGTTVSCGNDEKKFDLTTAFKDRGPVSIAAALGLGRHLNHLPYKFFGGQNNFKMPDIDYLKYLHVKPRNRRPSADFMSKFSFLEYVIEYWPWHTRWLQWTSSPHLSLNFSDLVQHKSLAFEFRPWDPNKHFGPNGCQGCPVPFVDDLGPEHLPSMALVHWAAKVGHLRVFDILKPPLQEYLRHERNHDETLLIACRNGQDAVVEILLNQRTFDLSNGRAIAAACASGNASVLDRLLQAQEALPTLTNRPSASLVFDLSNIGHDTMYQAATNGFEKIVEILLLRGAQASASDPATGLTSLQSAAKNGHLQVVKALQSHATRLTRAPRYGFDTPQKRTGMKALHWAAANGYDEVVAFLTQHGFGCDDRNSLDETALIKASQKGNAIVAKVLLDRGADPLLRGGVQYRSASPLFLLSSDDTERESTRRPMAVHHAASNGHENVLAILPCSALTCGINETNALHLGAAYGHPKVVQALLRRGARIESKDAMGMTALHHASCNGKNRVIQLLLDRGCDINWRADGGYTALHFAAGAAKTETIKLLVAYGAALTAKISEQEREGDTALHLAVRHADEGTLRALVDCGAALEEHNRHGRTALDEAIVRNRPANMLALIELGAQWILDKVFLQAVKADDWNIVEILLSKLSTVTVKEQGEAAAVIKRMLEKGRWSQKEEAAQILRFWQKTSDAGVLVEELKDVRPSARVYLYEIL